MMLFVSPATLVNTVLSIDDNELKFAASIFCGVLKVKLENTVKATIKVLKCEFE